MLKATNGTVSPVAVSTLTRTDYDEVQTLVYYNCVVVEFYTYNTLEGLQNLATAARTQIHKKVNIA